MVGKFIYLKTIVTKSGIKKSYPSFFKIIQHHPDLTGNISHLLSRESYLQPKQREARNHALRESRFFLSPLLNSHWTYFKCWRGPRANQNSRATSETLVRIFLPCGIESFATVPLLKGQFNWVGLVGQFPVTFKELPKPGSLALINWWWGWWRIITFMGAPSRY